MVEFDPEGVLAALHRQEVEFVIIGGYAVNLRSSPFLTQDIDGRPFAHGATSLAEAGVWNLVTDRGRSDISLVPDGTDGYDDLKVDSDIVTLSGIEVRVVPSPVREPLPLYEGLNRQRTPDTFCTSDRRLSDPRRR